MGAQEFARPLAKGMHENFGAKFHSEYMDECTGNGKYLESFLRSSSVPATLGDALLFDAPYFKFDFALVLPLVKPIVRTPHDDPEVPWFRP